MTYTHTVNSSMIDSPLRYDSESETLTLKFLGTGKTFEYEDFTMTDWQDLTAADSAGKFWHQRIKGKYSFKEV
jgi:hypothetical protein